MQSDFDKYLKVKLDNLFNVELNAKEVKQLELNQLSDFIYNRITSRKFRQNIPSKATLEDVKTKINLSIKENRPLHFLFLYGGYKNHRVTPHHPNIDWAEVFHLMYIAKLFAPVLKAYKPGVIYDLSSEDVAVTVNNNFTQAEVNAYSNSFNALISHFKKEYFPDNFDVKITRMRDRVNTDLLFYRVGKRVEEKINELNKLDKESLDKMIHRTLYNIKLDGYQDYTKYSKDKLNEVALESLAINHLYMEEDGEFSTDYFTGDNHIPMIGSYCEPEENSDGWITINSCARSKNAFWTSRGIVTKANANYEPSIISAKSFEEIKPEVIQEESSIFSNVVSNLKSIDVQLI